MSNLDIQLQIHLLCFQNMLYTKGNEMWYSLDMVWLKVSLHCSDQSDLHLLDHVNVITHSNTQTTSVGLENNTFMVLTKLLLPNNENFSVILSKTQDLAVSPSLCEPISMLVSKRVKYVVKFFILTVRKSETENAFFLIIY